MKLFDIETTEENLLSLYPKIGDCYKSTDGSKHYIKVLNIYDKIIEYQWITIWKDSNSISIEVSQTRRLFMEKDNPNSFVYPIICNLVEYIPTEEYDKIYNKIKALC